MLLQHPVIYFFQYTWILNKYELMQVCGKHSLHRHSSWASPASSSQCSCADRPGGPLTVLNFWLPSQPAWPCVPGGVNWCSPNANKTRNEHSTGQSCATGAGSKGLEAFDGEEMMNVGAGATLCYKTNRNKLLTMQSQMCAGHQPSVPKFCQSNQFMLMLPYTSRAVAKPVQRQENFRIKATQNNP